MFVHTLNTHFHHMAIIIIIFSSSLPPSSLLLGVSEIRWFSWRVKTLAQQDRRPKVGLGYCVLTRDTLLLNPITTLYHHSLSPLPVLTHQHPPSIPFPLDWSIWLPNSTKSKKATPYPHQHHTSILFPSPLFYPSRLEHLAAQFNKIK